MRDHRHWLCAILWACLLAGNADAQPAALSAPQFVEAAPAEANRSIDLPTALRLAGVDNPQIQIARQRVVEAACPAAAGGGTVFTDNQSGQQFR